MLLVVVLILEILLPGCSAPSRSLKEKQRWYAFEYELMNTRERNSLVFVNEYLKASFSVDDTTITVLISNMMNQSLYLHYQRAMIGINNKYYPVGFIENEFFVPTSLTIPKNGSADTRIAPFRTLQNKKLQSLFKTADNADPITRKEILKQYGGSLTLILPMTINGKEVEQTFVLKIKKIRSSITQENLTRIGKKKDHESNKTFLPMVIVAAVTGSVLYLFSNNQKPPK